MTAVDVAIVGGGAVGAACARAAALRGLEVAIFEPGPDPAAASPASAGMLAAQIEPGDDVLVALSVRARDLRSEEHTSELQSHSDLVCRLLLEKKKKKTTKIP